MNRLYFLLAAGLISSAAVAQNQYDALKLMNNDLNGTARFVGIDRKSVGRERVC